MEDDLNFLQAVVRERITALRRELPAREGHGVSLIRGVAAACTRLEGEAAREASGPGELPVLLRRLHFVLGELELLHYLVAKFRSDVGRTDLPVGLLHLVDALIDDLLPDSADPILHLDDENMYSTLDVFQAAAGTLQPATQPTPHPVAFHVPGLDAGNALLSPILAHEVGHTSWRQGIADQLDQLAEHTTIEQALRTGVTPAFTADTLRDTYDAWREELMCDALAVT